jgi:hypothetical protein
MKASVSQGKYFSNAAKGLDKEWIETPLVQQINLAKDPWRGSYFSLPKDVVSILEWCYIGTLYRVEFIMTIVYHLWNEGLYALSVTPMGGKKVIIEVEKRLDFNSYVQNVDGILSSWFESFHSWNPKEVAEERMVWVRCQGLPFQAWDDDFIVSLNNMLDCFVSLDSSTMNKNRLDVVRILILTSSWDAIQKIINVHIDGHVFPIHVVEDVNTLGTTIV